jgi:Ca-activated chloride channel homolog
MAHRPSRPSSGPVVRWGTWLVILGLLGVLIGCGKKDEPPAQVQTTPAEEAAKKPEAIVNEDVARISLGIEAGRVDGKPQSLPSSGYTSLRTVTSRSGAARDKLLKAGGGQPAGEKRLGLAATGQAAPVELAALARGLADETPDMSAEQYQHFEDNPFKIVQGSDALSTISTAVDTASYANVRARINEGQLPAKDAVRIADFVNYFPYDYAAPKNGDPVAFKLELAPCPWQPKHHLLRVGLKARTIDKDQMPARNLVFLIDTSGSMQAPNRLPLVQESLKLLTEQLTGRDRVSIVTYAGTAGLLLPPTPGDQKERITQEILHLSAEGSTNGEGGLKAAYDQAEKSFLKDGINRVILATDGDFNVGVSNDAELVRLIEEKRKTGVYLTVLGFGMGNLQDAKLEQLAHHGNGHFAYIDSLDEAKKLFVEQGGALVTVAKDVKLQVEFNPAKIAGYRLIGYENRILKNEDFRNDAKDAGDLGSGHTSTALYEIVPVGEKVATTEVEPLKYQTKSELTEAAKTGEWLTVRMRYKHPETEKASEVSAVLGADGLAKDASADLRFASAVAAFGMILRDSEYRGDADYDKVTAWAKPFVGADPGGHRGEFVRLVERAKDVAAKKTEGQK